MHPVAYAKLRAAYDQPIEGWERMAEQEVIAKAQAHMLIAIKARKTLEAQRNDQAPA